MGAEGESVASAKTEKSNGHGHTAKNDNGNKNENGKNPSDQKKNRIQVSSTKKPLFFYVNLTKRYMLQHQEVELSALGRAIATVVTIAEILKNNGLATAKKILTSSVSMKDENKGRTIQKAKIEIVLEKSEKFDSLMVTTARAPEDDAEEKIEVTN